MSRHWIALKIFAATMAVCALFCIAVAVVIGVLYVLVSLMIGVGIHWLLAAFVIGIGLFCIGIYVFIYMNIEDWK